MIDQLRRIRAGLRFLWMRWVGHLPSHGLRKFFYRRAGMTIGQRSCIYSGAEVRNPAGIVIGDDVIIGHRAVLDGRCGLRIGNNVNLSTGVWIWTMQHDHQSETFEAVGAPVDVADNVWLSARVIVLPGVEIGERSVVAAGAVVTHNLPPAGIYGGVPARKIGSRNITIKYALGDTQPAPFI